MRLFDKRTPLQKRSEKRESILNQKLEEKIPPKLQKTLDTAFAKAFALIFEKGTGVIEKTYQRTKLEQDYQVRQYMADVKQNSKSLRSFSKKARDTGTKNLLLSGVSGIGMGVLGIGLPDIPVFTGMILKNIYETALQYGYSYESREEKYFILLLIRGAVSYGDTLCEIDGKVNEFIRNGILPEEYQDKEQIEQTAGALSKELLYMKFLQGIPVVGAVGGAYDAVYMKRITEYAELKYRHRYLAGRKKAENGQLCKRCDDKTNIDKVISALNIKSWKATEPSIGMNPKSTIKFYCDTTNQDEEKDIKEITLYENGEYATIFITSPGGVKQNYKTSIDISELVI